MSPTFLARVRPVARLLPVRASLGAGLLLLALPTAPSAHEVPADVTVQAWIHPEGGHLTLLVRAPLEAMRDIEWPLRGPGYLELDSVGPLLDEAARLWIAGYVRLYEDGVLLAPPEVVSARVSLPSDRSFRTFDGAAAHLASRPLAATEELPWQQAVLDVRLEVPITDPGARFSIDPRWAHLGLQTSSVLHFLAADGAERPFAYRGDPGVVHLDPQWHQAALHFVAMGFRHILGGLDHLLFLLCLVIPFRRLLPLVPVVTAFTLAHSITLAAAALDLVPAALWFPTLIETLIALSIVWMAIENILGLRLERRWLVAFVFGVVHGFGFSFLLAETLQFSGSHLVTALLSFNLGVELGQLAVLAAGVPLLGWLFRRIPERGGVIVASALVAHTGWHWMTERGSALLEYPIGWPELDAAAVAGLLRWAILMLVCAAAAWALSALAARLPAVVADAPAGEGAGGVGPGG
jgi:hypothetical protein